MIYFIFIPLLALAMAAARPAGAQLTDITQTPNALDAGIQKSLEEQIGAGRGDLTTPGSSFFIIKRDPFRAIARGRQLFQRKWTLAQGLGPRTGGGVGDLGSFDTPDAEIDVSVAAGLADSCAECHGRPRGSAGHGGSVFTRPDSRDAPHLFGAGLVEMIGDEITSDLRAIRRRAIRDAEERGEPVTVPLASKGIDYGELTAFPDGRVDPSRIDGVDPDLRVKPFFAEGSVFALRQFFVGAFNAEMGLEAPDPVLLAASRGLRVVSPAGMVFDGALDPIEPPPVTSPQEDDDGDGVTNEVDPALVDFMEFYLLNYFSPALYLPDDRGRDGDQGDEGLLARVRGQLVGPSRDSRTENARQARAIMDDIGCTSCHIPDLEIERDRRVADFRTVLDPERGVFNQLFATATERSVVVEDGGSLPPLRLPAEEPFTVRDIFADFKRHDLGPAFWERNFDGTIEKEFVTQPLWGVGTTAPYGHDGRSVNLRAVILRHGGEAQASRDAFAALAQPQQDRVLAFLRALVLFPPADTASNLDPGDPTDPDFPQFGHGSIDLSVLFNDPTDPE